MPELIILDVYGTILKADVVDGIVRPGLQELFAYYSTAKKAAFSDGNPEIVQQHLEAAGIIAAFDKVYDARNCLNEAAFTVSDEMLRKRLRMMLRERGGGNLKDLEQACLDFEVHPSNAVFIGDNFYGRDRKSAELHSIRFVLVPQYRERMPGWQEREIMAPYMEFETEPFSFVSLIGKL